MPEPIDWRVGELPGALADFEDNTFHACLADPSYGLSDPPSPDLVLRWLAGEEVEHKKGFLNRPWDSLPPGPRFWRELYRVLRPGALVMAFSHSRTFDLLGMSVRMAGFEMLPHFAWLHAQSQALGADVGKLIDKAAGEDREVVGEAKHSNRHGSWKAGSWQIDPSDPHGSTRGDEGRRYVTAPASSLAQLFDGHHTRVRSNMEPILCAMKPLDGTWSENTARWGCGGFNVTAGRVPTVNAADEAYYRGKHDSAEGIGRDGSVELQSGRRDEVRTNGYSPAGCFPSLPLLEHSVECEDGACVPGCPAAVLAEQGGTSGSGSGPGRRIRSTTSSQGMDCRDGHERSGFSAVHEYGDKGDCVRFYFQPRPARGERSAGCEGLYWQRDATHSDGWRMVAEADHHAMQKDGVTPLGNPHPAIKSLELTRYLAKILRQPGEPRIIVPFSGSGSEAIGAMLAGWHHVTAIEDSAQWVETARRREAFWRGILEKGAEGSIKDMLGEHSPAKLPLFDENQGSLFP